MKITLLMSQRCKRSRDIHCVSKKRHPFYFYDNFVRCHAI